MSSWKRIETSREVRLWLGQIIVPLATAVVIISPDARQALSNGYSKVRNTVVDKYHQIKDKLQSKKEN